MRTPLVVLAMALVGVGCGQRPTDDVRVRLDGAHLVLENRTGADIHYRLAASPMQQAETPASLPGNRLENGHFERWRVAPSQRGQSVEVHWWRPAKVADASGVRGPDRVRRLPLELVDPDPLPLDELAVRACIAAHKARARARPQTEDFCMQEAERCLNAEGGLCATTYHGWRKALDEARAGRS